MKAVLIPKTGTADVLDYVDVDTPIAGPGHLLVKIAAIGTGFGDIMQRMGLYPHMPPLPFITGHEATGVVTSVGDGVDDGWIGQRVVILSPGGCYAEYAICPESFAARLPSSVSDTVGAALAVNYLTAHYLLHRTATLTAGDTIVVYAAAGGVGSALVQMAKLMDLRIIGLAGSETKCQFVKEQGADEALNSSDGSLAERLRAAVRPDNAAATFNSVCGETLGEDLKILGRSGQLVLYGMAGGPPPPDFLFKFLEHFGDSLSLRMMGLESFVSSDPGDIARTLAQLVQMTAAGQLTPHIHAELPLSDAAAAHRLIESRKVMGKVVLTVA